MHQREHAVLCAFRILGSILALAGASTAALAAGQPTQFTLTGGVDRPGTYSLDTLQAQPAITQTVSFLGGGSNRTHTYTGASMWGIVNGAGIVAGSARGDILNKYVLATGSDGYKALFSMGELDPAYGGNPASFIALSETIDGVDTPLAGDGFARIVAPGDGRGSRYVSNLVSIEVFTAAPVPEPGTWALMVAGLAMLAWLGRTRAAGGFSRIGVGPRAASALGLRAAGCGGKHPCAPWRGLPRERRCVRPLARVTGSRRTAARADA